MRNVSRRSMSTTALGYPVSAPFGIGYFLIQSVSTLNNSYVIHFSTYGDAENGSPRRRVCNCERCVIRIKSHRLTKNQSYCFNCNALHQFSCCCTRHCLHTEHDCNEQHRGDRQGRSPRKQLVSIVHLQRQVLQWACYSNVQVKNAFLNREATVDLVRRAERANFKALVVTVDTPVLGKRLNNERNGFNLPSHLK